MSDIVERLRSPEVFFTTGQMYSPLAHAAADEIEKLRKALRGLLPKAIAIERARDALGAHQ